VLLYEPCLILLNSPCANLNHCKTGAKPQYAAKRARASEIGSNVALGLFKRLLGGASARDALHPLYLSVVAEARQPDWYMAGAVPDTLDGRFDMVGAVLSLVLLRFEQLGDDGRDPAVLLTEIFVDDMEGQLREQGVGDVVVGKHIGKMMSALGGRLTAYRAGLAAGGDLEGALTRNLYRGETPPSGALAYVVQRLRGLEARLAGQSVEALIAGRISG
jgi:cytochrome b pre-mRNA-processing protein 3